MSDEPTERPAGATQKRSGRADITTAAPSLHDRIVAAHQREKSRSTRTVDWVSFDAGFRAALREPTPMTQPQEDR